MKLGEHSTALAHAIDRAGCGRVGAGDEGRLAIRTPLAPELRVRPCSPSLTRLSDSQSQGCQAGCAPATAPPSNSHACVQYKHAHAAF